jgi:hypothetical protein
MTHKVQAACMNDPEKFKNTDKYVRLIMRHIHFMQLLQ